MSSFVPGVESGSLEPEPSSDTDAPAGPPHSADAGAAIDAVGPNEPDEPGTSASVVSAVRWKRPDPVTGRVLPSVAVIARTADSDGASAPMSIASGRPDANGTSITGGRPSISADADSGRTFTMVQSTADTSKPIGRTQTLAGSVIPARDRNVSKEPGVSHGPGAIS